MSFVLVRIIMSLIPFIKESFFKNKEKSPTVLALMGALIIMVIFFFVQADLITTLYKKYREDDETKNILMDQLDNIQKELEDMEGSYESELANMRAIILAQTHLLTNCTNMSEEEKKEGE